MNAFLLVRFGLFFHLAGIATMVGTTVAGMSAHWQFRRLLLTEKEKALIVLKATDRYPSLQGAGAITLLAGAILMMIGYQGMVMQLLWFKIKLIVISLIILNQVFIGLALVRRFRRQTEPAEMRSSVSRLTVFNAVQLTFFGVIFLLSTFKFS